MVWGGFPGGRTAAVESSRKAVPLNNILNANTLYNVGQVAQDNDDSSGFIPADTAIFSSHSLDGRSFANGAATTVSSGVFTDRYNYAEGSARMQITSAPMSNDPPPLILFRSNKRANTSTTTWEFYCKYTVTIEYARNQFRYDPLKTDSAMTMSRWAGTGNIGFVTLPGSAYDNLQDPTSRTKPFETPGSVLSTSAQAKKFYYDGGRGVAPRASAARAILAHFSNITRIVLIINCTPSRVITYTNYIGRSVIICPC